MLMKESYENNWSDNYKIYATQVTIPQLDSRLDFQTIF